MTEEGTPTGGEATPSGTGETGTGESSPQPTFLESLPEDMRGHSMLEGLDAKAEGSDVVKKLLDFADGVPKAPDSVEGYEFQIPDQYDYVNDAEIAAFKEFALAENIPADLAQKIVNFDLARMERTLNAIDTEQKVAQQELQKLWGENFEANKEKAVQVVKAFAPIAGELGGKPVTELLTQDGLFGFGNVPQVIALFHAISTAISEDWLTRGADNQSGDAEKSTAEVLYPSS